MHEMTYISPLGPIRLRADDDALLELTFGEAEHERSGDSPVLAATCAQLDEYFAGTRTRFDLPLRLEGTPWERRVWSELLQIGYGETASYGEIARELGHPTASRAVGAANGRNPIAIIVPCHRVIGSDGSLTGYAGGLACKRALLDLEAGRAALV
jgi:methylated-DNA-[protein]-cysteine S-methyltransferase